MKAKSRKYLLWLTACCLPILAAVAAANVAVDPQFIWGSPWGPAFLKYRDQLWTRTLKGELLRRSRADTLLLGTSVVNWGFDPDLPPLRGRSVFNSGWVSARVLEILVGLKYAISIHPPKEVIYFADFTSFMNEAVPRDPYYHSRLYPKLDKSNYFLTGMFGFDSTLQSAQLLKKRLTTEPRNYYRSNGFSVCPPSRDPGAIFENRARAWLGGGRAMSAVNQESNNQTKQFEEILRICADRGIKLTVALPPQHASHLELLWAEDLWETFENWQRNVARLIWKHNAELPPGAEPVRLWSFFRFDGPCAEPWIGQKPGEGADKWFLDPGHPRPAIGALVLSQIYGVPCADGPLGWVPGVELTEANLEETLREQTESRARYAHSGCKEVELISKLAREMGYSDMEPPVSAKH